MNDIHVQVARAISTAVMYGGTDDAHHKAWVIDQMVRELAGSHYDRIVAEAGEFGNYTWDTGIEPELPSD